MRVLREGQKIRDTYVVDRDGADNNPATYQDNNYRLVDGSKCIDQGRTETWMWSDVDLDGNPRVLFGGKSLTVDMGAYEYGSFLFRIVRIEKMPQGETRLTWASRSQDKYTIWSCKGLPAPLWAEEDTVASQGEFTTWDDKEKPSGKFYRVELLQQAPDVCLSVGNVSGKGSSREFPLNSRLSRRRMWLAGL
ncbi:hypothetical protein HQ563_14775 [bacterium]|nr:hypothetical protein [bacterium]